MAYQSKRIICTICARGGSKGVPRKNLKPLLNKPLIAYTIEQAIETKCFETIAVSSDDDEILEVSKKFGASILIKRPHDLATDTAAKIPVIQHCVLECENIKNIKYDIVVDLDASSPLRLTSDISNCINLLIKNNVKNVITAMPARRSPYFNLIEITQGVAHLSKQLPNNVVRRQDAPKAYDMNASIYTWKRDELFLSTSVFLDNTAMYEMPEERSIDIDNPIDFKLVELLMREKHE